MNLINVAVAVVFASNALILVLLVYMLVRILGATERTQRLMTVASRELTDSARVVRDAAYRIGDALQILMSRQPAATPTPVPGVQVLDKLNSMMEDLTGQGSVETDRALAEIKQMVERMAADPGARGAEGQQQRSADFEQVLNHRNRLAAEVDQMRKSLIEANCLIMDLRSANKTAEDSGETVDAMRAELARHQQHLDQARERIRQAEERAEGLAADLAARAAAGEVGSDEALVEARRQLAEAARERERHQREIDSLNEAMRRTLVEKDFIEDRFLQMDGERTAEPEDVEPASAASQPAEPQSAEPVAA